MLGYIKKLDEEQNPKEEYYISESHNTVRALMCSHTKKILRKAYILVFSF
jgi:hypothetical protein